MCEGRARARDASVRVAPDGDRARGAARVAAYGPPQSRTRGVLRQPLARLLTSVCLSSRPTLICAEQKTKAFFLRRRAIKALVVLFDLKRIESPERSLNRSIELNRYETNKCLENDFSAF